ncbi:MAG: UPF0175 family protein [Pyrinomonadaceae bacterium]|nr:UPF0175 family protein [Pyrinomonadaceae bacterium]
MISDELKLTLPFSISEDEARLLFAVELYEVGKVSLGQAAGVAGYSKRAFMDVLGRHKIPVFNYPAEDLQQELSG